MKRWIPSLMIALGTGCSSGAPAAVAPSAPPVPASPAPALLPRAEPSATASAAPAPSPAPAASAAPDPGPPFPPPPFSPPFDRTAKPGDGTWTPLVPGAPGAPPLLAQTTVHPDPIKPHVYAVIVAVDLRRVDLRFVAGTLEPLSKTVPPEHRPGLIPEADRDDLLVVFNGGFMAKHGGYGMMINGETFLPPREDACTVALGRDGSIRIRSWPVIKAAPGDLLAYRQTPSCLVEQGVVSSTLEADPKTHHWGTSETGDVEIRRSALGLDASGKTLFYGLGEWIPPKALADSMRAAGAVDAAELDVNWSYTRFLLYGRPAPGQPPEVASTLIPKTKHAPKQYVLKGSERDFFYLVKKR